MKHIEEMIENAVIVVYHDAYESCHFVGVAENEESAKRLVRDAGEWVLTKKGFLAAPCGDDAEYLIMSANVSYGRKFVGIYAANNKYNARITVDKKSVHLGAFDTEEAAARAYDVAAMLLGRPLNSLNFPDKRFTLPEVQATMMLLHSKAAVEIPSLDEYRALQMKALSSMIEAVKGWGHKFNERDWL